MFDSFINNYINSLKSTEPIVKTIYEIFKRFAEIYSKFIIESLKNKISFGDGDYRNYININANKIIFIKFSFYVSCYFNYEAFSILTTQRKKIQFY